MSMHHEMEKALLSNPNSKLDSDTYGIPYDMAFVGQDGKLVVGIDPIMAQKLHKSYTKDDVKKDLQTNDDVKTVYAWFKPETGVTVVGGTGAVSTGTFAATITLVRNNMVITTGHLATQGTSVAVGLSGGTACGLTHITYNPIGTRSNILANNRQADSAYISLDANTISNCGITQMSNKVQDNTGTYSVTDGTISDIPNGASIFMSGIASNHQNGQVLNNFVTVDMKTDNNGHDVGILRNQVAAQYNSADTDSGAPILVQTGSTTAKIVGQHEGKLCYADMLGGLNINTQNCNNNLKVFSPWPGVKANLGLP